MIFDSQWAGELIVELRRRMRGEQRSRVLCPAQSTLQGGAVAGEDAASALGHLAAARNPSVSGARREAVHRLDMVQIAG